MGKSVALLEPTMHLGGMSVEGLGGTDIDTCRASATHGASTTDCAGASGAGCE
ncbi:MAG: hypothetical protein ACK41O_15535 [Runella zeae]